MLLHSARPAGGVLLIALSTALIAAPLPVLAAQRAPQPILPEMIVALDDAYTVAAGQALQIVAPGVAGNDTSGGAFPALEVKLLSGPGFGTLALDADGGFTYVPRHGFTGMDKFRYGVSNGSAYGEAAVLLSVTGQVDVALSAMAAPTRAPLGKPVTFTFRLVNHGPGDAADVRLDVTLPRGGKFDVRPDTRCLVMRERWSCPMGALGAGGAVQASFLVAAPEPALMELAGAGYAADDNDPSNDTATALAEAGQLLFDPGHVVARAPWSAKPQSGMDVTVTAGLQNQTLAAMAYEIQPRDFAGDFPAWLSVIPRAGAIDAAGAQPVKIVLSPAAQPPGLKRALLHVEHDSAFAMADVPVSFTVAFQDVPEDRADDPYVHALAGAGVTAGCAGGAFCPDKPLARGGAAVWLLLAREGAAYQPPPARGVFGDVAATRADAPFIEEIARRGVVEACAADPGNLFCPDQGWARADAAVAVLRMLEGPDYVPPVVAPTFKDLGRDPRAMFVEDAVRRGLFTACSPGQRLFCPRGALTRGDAAVAVVKAFQLPIF